MMPSATQLCFAVFLASFPCTRAQASTRESQYNGNTLEDDQGSSSSNHTSWSTCSWNCMVIHSDFPDRLITLVVEYEKKMNEKCVKRSSRTSSENATEYFKEWLQTNNKLSSFDNVIQSLLNWDFSSYTEERFKVKPVCNFRPLSRNLEESSREAISTRNAGFRSRFFRSLLADNGVEVKKTVKSVNNIHFLNRESQYNGNTLEDDNGSSSSNLSTCSWNCTVIHSDFPDRLITLVVEYEKKINEKCVKLSSRTSSGNATEYFKEWLPANNKLSSFDNVIQCLLNWDVSSLTEERFKVKAVCNFRPLSRNLKASSREAILTRKAGFRSRFVRSLLADNSVEVKKTVKSVNNTNTHFTQELRWLQHGFYFFGLIFVIAFIYYSPAFICLFTPTVITENGRRQIVLEGASPVGFRSLVGNYFFARDDSVHTWYKARMLIFRLVVLPLPFLPLAIIFDYVQHQVENLRVPLLDLSRPFMIICFVCYTIQAIRDSSYKMANITRPCLVCRKVKPVNFTCKDPVLPRRLLNHLRLQPLILVKCWKLFVRYLVSYFKLAQFTLSTKWFVRIPVFIVFLSVMPAVVIICLVTMLVVVLVAIFLTSPNFILCTATSTNRSFHLYRLLEVLMQYFIIVPAIVGTVFILLCAALTALILITIAFALLLSEESLPFVALIILVSYYCWSDYSSFKNKYHNLSLKLFKCYQKYRHDQISDEAAAMTTTEPIQAENTPSPKGKGNVVKIPKELFDMACEKLMPIIEGVCKLVLKVFFILSFVFLAFLLIMGLHIDATPGMKALVTFFTGSFPKVVAICIDGERQQNTEAIITEERAAMIVQDYINGTPSANQLDNSEENTEEVIICIVDDNEETIDLR